MDTTLVDEKIKELYLSYRTIAIVGASPDSKKTSNIIMKYLRNTGYKVFPVNPKPGIKEIRNLKVYPNLSAIDRPVDMVEVFRKSEDLYEIAEEAISIGAKVLWGQIGVINHDAAKIAEDAGLKVVMNRCPKIELFRPFWKPRLDLKI